MADEQEEYKMTASEKKKEDWMNSKWRPMKYQMAVRIAGMHQRIRAQLQEVKHKLIIQRLYLER